MPKKKSRRSKPATPDKTRRRGRIFLCMPYGEDHSDALHETLAGYCQALGLVLRRADRSRVGASIIENIVTEMHAADGVVVDATRCNPNVMYELGMLDRLDKPVFLLWRAESRPCVDIRNRNAVTFEDLTHTKARSDLIRRFDAWLEEFGIGRPPPILDTPLERTEAIVAALQDLVRREPRELGRFSVRFSGGLSAFAISEEEISATAVNQCENEKQRRYLRALADEQRLLAEAVAQGHQMRCLIHWNKDVPHRSPIWITRVKRLKAFLQNRSQRANRFIEWKRARYRPPNVYIIGESVVFEGVKTEAGGYHLTLQTTDAHSVRFRTQFFDGLFQATPPEEPRSASKDQWREDLRNSVLKCLDELLDEEPNSTGA